MMETTTNTALSQLLESGILGVLLVVCLSGIGYLLQKLLSSYTVTIDRLQDDIKSERLNNKELVDMIRQLLDGHKDVIKTLELLNQKQDNTFNSLPCKIKGTS